MKSIAGALLRGTAASSLALLASIVLLYLTASMKTLSFVLKTIV